MGADAYIAFYGIERALDSNTEENPLAIHARRHGLHSWSGRVTEETGSYILIGRRIALLGLENDIEATLKESEFQRITAETKTKLANAGFTDEPQLIFKFEVDY